MAIEVRSYGSPAAAEKACAETLSAALAAALATAKSRVSFMVSGGNTPRRVLPLVLAADIDWQRVDVFASDERLVPVDHPDSTEGMVRQLFSQAMKPLNYLGFGDDTSPETARAAWTAALETAVWPVAAGLIGIGEDAHFASLFPGRPEIADPNLFAAAVPETPPHKHARLTLGRRAFAQCDLLALVVAGAGKRAMLKACLSNNANPQALPAALIAEQGHVIAFTD